VSLGIYAPGLEKECSPVWPGARGRARRGGGEVGRRDHHHLAPYVPTRGGERATNLQSCDWRDKIEQTIATALEGGDGGGPAAAPKAHWARAHTRDASGRVSRVPCGRSCRQPD
jgi:hypothetical protein